MFTICLTHDVDTFYPSKIAGGVYRLLGKRTWRSNPFDTFNRITSIEKEYNASSTFFFLDHTDTYTGYRFHDEPIKKLIRSLSAKGAEIALHGSSRSATDRHRLYPEKIRLEEVLGRPVYGIRQHQLHLDVPRTFELERDVGLLYDSTYYPPKYFRSRVYKPFYAVKGLLEIPLTLLERDYYGMTGKGIEHVWERIKTVIDKCAVEEGVCTVLWHPHAFYDESIEYHRKNYPGFAGFAELYRRILGYGEKIDAKMCSCYEVYLDWKECGECWW